MSKSLDDVMTRYPGAQTFTFGDNPGMSAELLDLVRSGQKTATCDALMNYPEGRYSRQIFLKRNITKL